MNTAQKQSSFPLSKKIGIIAGPILFFIIIFSPFPSSLPYHPKVVLAIAAWMIVWWITEAISVYATALLPLGLMPATGVLPLNAVAAEYMHPIVVLLLGMFLIAIAVERSGLHKKIAFTLISLFGYSPKRIVLGFIIASAMISTVVMSTTTVLIMLPITFVIISALSNSNITLGRGFTIALMLGIAYGSSVGSVFTLVGAPPNLIYAGTVNELFGHVVTFGEWSVLGAPLGAIMLVATSIFMTKKIGQESPELRKTIRDILLAEKAKVGKTTLHQMTVLSVLVSVLMLMFTAPYFIPAGTFITNSVIAILGGISLFVIPSSRSERLLDWAGVEKLPFGVPFLLGGGLALSLAFINSGLAEWLADALSFIKILPFEVVVLIVVSMVMFMSNVKSNTATAAIFIPVIANMAIINNWSPLPTLFGITIASSFAFLLPMGTPPNTLVYERAKITMKEMFTNGLVLNAISIALIALFTIVISPMLLPNLGS